MAGLSFTERMDQGKALAQIARNKGFHTGKSAKGWNVKRQLGYDRDSWEWLCKQARDSWRSECIQARGDFYTAAINGTPYGDYDALQIN